MQFNREPVALVQGLLVPIALAVVLLCHLNDNLAGALNTLIMAVGGLVAAVGVAKADAALPLLAGLAKAVLAVLLAWGVDVPETWQTFVLSAVGIVVAYLTRPQVTAKKSDYGLAA
jgi:hypothetical protein